MPSFNYNFFAKLSEIPDKLISTIILVITYMLYIAIFIAMLLIIWGIIEWTTGWNEMAGKRNIIRGVVLFIVATTFIVV